MSGITHTWLEEENMKHKIEADILRIERVWFEEEKCSIKIAADSLWKYQIRKRKPIVNKV